LTDPDITTLPEYVYFYFRINFSLLSDINVLGAFQSRFMKRDSHEMNTTLCLIIMVIADMKNVAGVVWGVFEICDREMKYTGPG